LVRRSGAVVSLYAAICLIGLASCHPAYAQATAQAKVIGTTTNPLTSLMPASDGEIYGVIQGNASSCHSYSTSCGNLINLTLLGSMTTNFGLVDWSNTTSTEARLAWTRMFSVGYSRFLEY
jgi:hypothetical protein